MAFGTGTLLWCLASWYTARVLLYTNLPASQDLYVDEDDTGRLDISGWLETCREFWAPLRLRSLDTACCTRSALMKSIRRFSCRY